MFWRNGNEDKHLMAWMESTGEENSQTKRAKTIYCWVRLVGLFLELVMGGAPPSQQAISLSTSLIKEKQIEERKNNKSNSFGSLVFLCALQQSKREEQERQTKTIEELLKWVRSRRWALPHNPPKARANRAAHQ